jgi:tetratricopeptide (TPR) repeat protein
VARSFRSRAGVASLAILAMLVARVGRADEDPRLAAERLAHAALAEQKRGDEMEAGWEQAYDSGIALANQAIAVDAGAADAYFALFVNLGRKSERSGVGSQALNVARLKELLRKTLELDPQHAHAWEAQGEMLTRLPWLLGGSDEEGKRALRHAAELAPNWARPRLRLAELAFEQGHEAKARREAERARDLARGAGDEEDRADAEALLTKLDQSGR